MSSQMDNVKRADADIADKLNTLAEQTNPNPLFTATLERKLKEARKPKTSFRWPLLKQVVPVLGWVALVVALGFLLDWAIRTAIPTPQPATGNGTPGFICPVTQPNGSLPPGETVESPDYLGNDELWTGLWPGGKVYMLPENREADGSFSMKWWWWRAIPGEPLTIEGRRLDAQADPLRAMIPEGYDSNFQVAALIFPTTGCWEVTGRVGESSLTFITEVVFGEATPTPNVTIIDKNATPVPDDGGYTWRGAKLYLAQPLPQSPNEANVYLLNKGKSIPLDEVRVLAERFGIQGEIYNGTDRIYKYTITDGKQWLSVGSSGHFFYTSNLVKYTRNSSGAPNDNAEAIIREFLQTRDFDFPFSISNRELFGSYVLQQIAPDGLPMQYEYFSMPVARVTLDENSEVLAMDANWMDLNQTPVGAYGIITAEEALQNVLDDSIPAGKIESVHSGGGAPPQQWYRQYPDGQEVTIYGALTIAPAVDSFKPALLAIDGVIVVGNTDGLEGLDNYAFIKATGKYISENGIRKFNVESWDANAPQDYVTGSLRREGDQIILASDDGKNEYPLIDPPADVPLDTKFPESQLSVSGVIVDGKMDWTYIVYFADSSQMGGGGGGGGLGFYQLNLSGTPIPFPTLTPTPSVTEAPALTRLDGMRGMLNVNIYSNGDGTQRAEYGFIIDSPQTPYLFLEGNHLQDLQGYNNKPVEIWGAVDHTNENGTPVVSVEKYEIPFPDLKPQILKGTEKSVELDGKNVVLFTAESGMAYAEFTPGCNDMIPMESMSGTKGSNTGDKSILLEALAVPDLSFANYPGICVFSSASATQPNGEPMEMTISSDQPNVMPEPPTLALHPPKLTIDKVELIYYVSNPNYQVNDPGASQREPYLQPVWHFHGRYETGDEFDVIVQALKRDFLSPDLAPYIQGG